MGKKLAECLGIDDREFVGYPHFINPPKIPNVAHMFYIYSDIVSNSYMGGQQASLLDVFPLPSAYAKSSNFTMYKNVSKPTLTDISVKITDQFGKKPKLSSNVDMVVEIHFKRVYD